MEKEIKKKYRQSQFDSCVKVKRVKLLWLKDNKDTKTVAGYLDKLINKHINERPK